MMRPSLIALTAFVLSCGAPQTATAPPLDPVEVERAVASVLDDWHEAAANADEERYFGHFTPSGVFIGTDATERWDVEAFREYAHPHFAEGEAWSFRAERRAVIVADCGRIAWFDEDLETENLGPARGSGVMVLDDDGQWRIAHYVLSLSIPNERFRQVREALTAEPESSESIPQPEE